MKKLINDWAEENWDNLISEELRDELISLGDDFIDNAECEVIDDYGVMYDITPYGDYLYTLVDYTIRELAKVSGFEYKDMYKELARDIEYYLTDSDIAYTEDGYLTALIAR